MAIVEKFVIMYEKVLNGVVVKCLPRVLWSSCWNFMLHRPLRFPVVLRHIIYFVPAQNGRNATYAYFWLRPWRFPLYVRKVTDSFCQNLRIKKQSQDAECKKTFSSLSPFLFISLPFISLVLTFFLRARNSQVLLETISEFNAWIMNSEL